MKRVHVVCLMLLVVAVSPGFAWASPDRKEIVRAEYGAGNYWADVTDRVTSLLQGDELNFRVDTTTFGVDPAPREPKSLRLEIRNRNGAIEQMTFQENQSVRLRGYTVRGSSANRLQILHGVYGDGRHSMDVTERLNSQIRDGQLHVDVTSEALGGDPARGRRKTLNIEYILNGATQQAVFNEGEVLDLSVPSSPEQGRLEILSAQYGSDRRTIDVTERLSSLVRRGRLDTVVTDQNMGGDPDRRRRETLSIRYSYNGRRNQAIFNEGDAVQLPNSTDLNIRPEDSNYRQDNSRGDRSGADSNDSSRNDFTTIPSGARISIQTYEAIDSRKAKPGQTFAGAMAEDIHDNQGQILLPRGSDVTLIIRDTSNSNLVLDIDSVTVAGQRYQVSTEDLQKKGRQGIGANKRTVQMVGGGAALGAIIGAIAGGGRGAAIGAGVGAAAGAGTEVLTQGKDIHVPSEALLNFTLDEDLHLQRVR